MSSLTPGQFLRGHNWDYRIEHAVKGDGTHISTVFKAKVIPHENAPNAPQWAILKEAPPDDKAATENLEREHQNYLLPGVASTTYFRQMYDLINNRTIALEWLDTTLADVKYELDKRTFTIIKAFLRTALSSCVVLERQSYVNTDVKPANILLSGVTSGRVTAKVGDLGLVVPAGHLLKAQPYAMRAPEVFLGQACTEPSQVWAVAAMLLCWIKPGVLGNADSPHFLVNEAWCMAKIKRLFPDWNIPTPDKVKGESLKATVASAIRISREEQDLQAIQPFNEETEKMRIPRQLKDLLRLMLIVNPEERPSAESVLTSKEFWAFENL